MYQDFTLLLLIKGRHEFTKRWLLYMRKIKFPFKIVIADGENDNYTENLLKKFNQDNLLSIKYLKFNTHNGYLEYYKMISSALDKIDTKFLMWCDNDDFILLNGLNKNINFLKNNESYISCGSRILNFEIDDFSNVESGKEINLVKPYTFYRKEDSADNINEQVKKVFSEFQPNFYNIFYVKDLKNVIEEVIELNFSELFIFEYYIQLRFSLIGKTIYFDKDYHYFRQQGTSQTSKDYIFSKNLVKNNLPEDIRKLAEKISSICFEDSSKKEELKKNILNEFSNYLNFWLSHTVLKYRFKKLYKLKIFLKNFEKKYLYFFVKLKKILNNVKYKKNLNLNKEIKNEIKEIKLFLKNYNNC